VKLLPNSCLGVVLLWVYPKMLWRGPGHTHSIFRAHPQPQNHWSRKCCGCAQIMLWVYPGPLHSILGHTHNTSTSRQGFGRSFTILLMGSCFNINWRLSGLSSRRTRRMNVFPKLVQKIVQNQVKCFPNIQL